MQTLPIGVQDFAQLRQNNLLYVDKTARLLELIENGGRYFLFRPRRFGKSLTLSTLDAMFSGRKDLFIGLAAEQWVNESSENSSPVLRFDMSTIAATTSEDIKLSLQEMIYRLAEDFNLNIRSQTLGGIFIDLIRQLQKRQGQVVILIDEYDKPILDNLSNLKKANDMREVIHRAN